MFKKIVFSAVCLCFANTNVFCSSIPSTSVHVDNLYYKVHDEGEKILSRKNINPPTLSWSLMQEYENYLAAAQSQAANFCYNHGCAFIDLDEVIRITEDTLRSFIQLTESAVVASQLDSGINDAVCDLLHKKGLVKNDAFKKSETEYNSRYNNVKNKLNGIMANNYRDYVTKQEIERIVKEEFTVFVARIKQGSVQKLSTTTNSDWISDLNQILTTSQQLPQTITQYSYDTIYKSELDNQAILMADVVLAEKGYCQDLLPARVISDYGDAIKKIIRDAKTKMDDFGRQYLSYKELKKIAKINLKPIINKIEFRGETCSICLCEFSSDEELGFLQCGHFFHKDCIKQSLKKSGLKCPLCRTYADKIEHTELVP